MPQPPTISDYLDSIRALLDAACKRLEQDLGAAENQFAGREQSGAFIRKALDLGNQHFERNINSTLREMHWVLSRASLDQRELTEFTLRELTNFLNRTKKIILGFLKRRIRSGVAMAKLIDQEMQELDHSLKTKTRQMEGLLDLVEPPKPKTGAHITAHRGHGRVESEALFAQFFSDPTPRDGVAAHSGDAVHVGTMSGSAESAAVPTCNSPVRQRPEEAELLARTLRQSVSGELERLKAESRNQQDAALVIDYLTNVATTLDQIATAVGEAKRETASKQADGHFEEAERLAFNLAKAARQFAENNHRSIINFGGNAIFIVLGTALFATTFGAGAGFALETQLALLNMPAKTGASRDNGASELFA